MGDIPSNTGYAYDLETDDEFTAVLTGGPSCGKSSLLRELSARGYDTVPEAARLHIDQQISEGYDEDEIFGNMEEFQEAVAAIDRELEEQLKGEVFLDRAYGDNIGYYRHNCDEEREDIIEEVEGRYDAVFALEPLEFEDDYARQEDAEEAREIHETVVEGYEDAGYDVIEVPLMPIDERADFVLDVI